MLPSLPFALSLSKPVLSDAAGGVEGGLPERSEGLASLRSAKGFDFAQPERMLV